jgi:hypothetical protein
LYVLLGFKSYNLIHNQNGRPNPELNEDRSAISDGVSAYFASDRNV